MKVAYNTTSERALAEAAADLASVAPELAPCALRSQCSILAGGDQNGGGLDGNQEMILRGSYDPDVDTMWSVSRYARGGAQGSPDMPALFGKVTGQD